MTTPGRSYAGASDQWRRGDIMGEVNTEWVSAKDLDMLPNTPVKCEEYAIESHSNRK
jgi:hypothetical protein